MYIPACWEAYFLLALVDICDFDDAKWMGFSSVAFYVA